MEFDPEFRRRLRELLAWRRDVRRFRREALDEGQLDELLATACLAPSVGLAQPWRFVVVRDPSRRTAVRADFERCNARALEGYDGDRAKLYTSLKLSGLDDAPEQLAVFVDPETARGHRLGRGTMPVTLEYSVVTAVHTLWLAARADGVGVGWVSIVEPERIREILDVPATWRLVAYLCIGRPVEEDLRPELERRGWENRAAPATFILHR